MVRNTNRKTKIPPPVVAPPVDLRYTVQSSLLLRMAPELKNRVLELVCSDTTIHFSRKMKSGNAPGFLVACKQLHAESILLFYSLATFSFFGPGRLYRWLHKLTMSRLKLAPSVFIKDFPVYNEHLRAAKAGLGSLVLYRGAERQWIVVKE